MDKKEIIVLDNVDIVTYSAAVSDIANHFFDEDGNYIPHFGRINAVAEFFNDFVDISSLKAYFVDVENLDVDFLLANEECLKLYNSALKGDTDYKLNFANAYADAMEIVRTRNSTLFGVVEKLQNGLTKLVDTINPIFSEETINQLSKISEDVSKGDLNAEAIVKALGNSKFSK